MNKFRLYYQARRQNGIAVVSAMLLAALTTIIVGQMVWQQHLLISEIENQQSATQAMLAANAAVNWSRAILAEDAKSSLTDHNKEVWATRLPPTPIEGGKVSGYIIDQQQFFNLNNVASENSAQAAFTRLLDKLNTHHKLSATLADWIDADDISNGAEGAESSYYLNQHPEYLAANQMLTDLGNLIRIKGFDKYTIDKIAPFTTTLPQNTEINVNTASAEVLSFVLPDTSMQVAQTLIAARNVAYFKDVSDFKTRLPSNIDVSNINLSVNSHYFLVTCIAQFERTTLKVESLLYRDDNGWPIIIWKRIV